MSKIQDGGPAFPFTYEAGDGAEFTCAGMTLRDWFAGQAMFVASVKAEKGLKEYELVALFGDRGGIRPDEIVAALAYRAADAMLVERQRSTS